METNSPRQLLRAALRLSLILALSASVGTATSGARTVAETVTITGGPSGSTTSTSATFTFNGSSGVTSFRCQLDGGAQAPCTSPITYSNLALGSHLFRVYGYRGNVDLNVSAVREWQVVSPDQTPPETTITTQVPAQTKATSMTIAFTASEPASFQCKLDAAGFAPCQSPVTYTGLSLGQHTFQVYATDAAANSDFSPAVASWAIVSNVAPVAKIGFLQAKARPQPVTRPLIGTYTLPVGLAGATNVTGPPGAFKVVDGKLVAAAGATVPAVTEGKDFTFSGAGSSDADGTIVEYEWSVWKGNAFEKKQDGPSATFTTSFTGAGGWSSVQLVVIDDEGAAGTVEFLVKVNPDCVYEITSGRFRAEADCFRKQIVKKQGPTVTTRWTTYPAGFPARVNGIEVDPEGKTKKLAKVDLPFVVEKTAGGLVAPGDVAKASLKVKSLNAVVRVPAAELYKGRVAWEIAPSSITNFKLGGKLTPKLRGLRIAGLGGLGVPLLTAEKGSAISVWLALPERLGGVTADKPVVLKQGGGSSLGVGAASRNLASASAAGDLKFTVENAAITPYFTVRKLEVTYTAQSDLWDVTGRVLIDAFGYEALLSLKIQADSLKEIHAALDNLNLCAAVLACLQKLSLDVVLGKAKDTFTGGVELSLLQKVAGASIATIDGKLTMWFPANGPASARVEGAVNLFGEKDLSIAQGLLETSTNGFVHVAGGMTYGFKGLASIEGKIDAWYKTPKFNAYGEIEGCVFDIACAGGQAVVSTKGIAACLIIDYELDDWRPGIAMQWGSLPTVFVAGCDVGPYKEKLPASTGRLLASKNPNQNEHGLPGRAGRRLAASSVAPISRPIWALPASLPRGDHRTPSARGHSDSSSKRAAAETTTLDIPAGLPGLVVAVTGSAAPPKVTLLGPKGEQVATPAGPGSVREKPFFLVQGPPTKTTYIAIWKPSAGAWKIVQQPGSSPIVAIKHALGIPAPSVTAKVTGSGQARTLAYSFAPRAGQVVTFWEEAMPASRGSAAHSSVIGRVVSRATGRRQEGTIPFHPTEGWSSTRRIVAQVEQDGLVRRVIRVGMYNASAPPPVGKPENVHIDRVGRDSLIVTWDAAANATAYAVELDLDDGRRIFVPAPRKRQVTVGGIARSVGASVKVRGLRASTHTAGPAATKASD